MKNRSIVNMVCDQYNVDHRDITVEFIYAVGSKYVYDVTYSPEYDKRSPWKIQINVEVIPLVGSICQ